MRNSILFLAILLISACKSSSQDQNLLLKLMEQEPDKFSDIIANTERYEIQIIYTQINRDQNNHPTFSSHYYNVDSNRYFYPASTIKLPMVLLALEKISAMKSKGVDKFTSILHDSVYRGQVSVLKDTTSETGFPSIAHYIKKILVVSDNDGYNRLYEFVGQKNANARLKELGYKNLRVLHRLERPLTQDENRHTEAVRFMKNSKAILQQPMLVNDVPIIVKDKILKGKGFMRNDSLILQPFDFTYKNFFPLTAQHAMLKSILFAETTSDVKNFSLRNEDRKFVLQYMSQLPGETTYPAYHHDTTFYDAYCKFLMYGSERGTIPPNIRIFNKIGDAYGYLIDNAYVVDFENKVEFMLSAVINANTDSVYNDNNYDYEKLGFPFMKNLGQLIYRYELKRERKNMPDLSAFNLKYERKR